ncbi:hypothetical protein Dimus_033893 [Dionaea muscipula]
MIHSSSMAVAPSGILELNKDGGSLVTGVYNVISESRALKMLNNTNLFLVSIDVLEAEELVHVSGLCLRFNTEIVKNSLPCLITVTT